MATNPRDRGGASALPLNLIAQAIPKLTRNDLEALTERLIECLDQQDGDLETYEGDTEDAFAFSATAEAYRRGLGLGCPISDRGGIEVSEDEPDFVYQQGIRGGGRGPGCPISDPDFAVDDKGCDEDFDLEHDYRDQPRPAYNTDQRVHTGRYLLGREASS